MQCLEPECFTRIDGEQVGVNEGCTRLDPSQVQTPWALRVDGQEIPTAQCIPTDSRIIDNLILTDKTVSDILTDPTVVSEYIVKDRTVVVLPAEQVSSEGTRIDLYQVMGIMYPLTDKKLNCE
jgi:hypothetical protein